MCTTGNYTTTVLVSLWILWSLLEAIVQNKCFNKSQPHEFMNSALLLIIKTTNSRKPEPTRRTKYQQRNLVM